MVPVCTCASLHACVCVYYVWVCGIFVCINMCTCTYGFYPSCGALATPLPSCGAIVTPLPSCGALATPLPSCGALTNLLPSCGALAEPTPPFKQVRPWPHHFLRLSVFFFLNVTGKDYGFRA